MSTPKLFKFGVPIMTGASKVSQTGGKIVAPSLRHQTGVCGIEPYKPPPPPPPPIPQKFPDHLLRPPCLPGSQVGRFPPDCFTFKGYYCPTERAKYVYPPFSDNIDFIPSGDIDCWWAKPRVCDFEDMDENLPIKI